MLSEIWFLFTRYLVCSAGQTKDDITTMCMLQSIGKGKMSHCAQGSTCIIRISQLTCPENTNQPLIEGKTKIFLPRCAANDAKLYGF